MLFDGQARPAMVLKGPSNPTCVPSGYAFDSSVTEVSAKFWSRFAESDGLRWYLPINNFQHDSYDTQKAYSGATNEETHRSKM